MTVLENVVLGSHRGHGVPRAEAEAAARAQLERLGLAGREDDRPDELSGGQQQRVALARAFLARPRAMLLDEVTSALDPELVGEVLTTVRALKDEGVTMLIATHEMGFAREVADRVCFLHEGRLVEVGPPGAGAHRAARAGDEALPEAAARGRPRLNDSRHVLGCAAGVRGDVCFADMADRARWGPEIKTLGGAVREFARRHSPWMIGGAVLALVAIRVLIDEPLTWRDAVAVATMAVVYPFGEWAIHVYLLHAKPITLRGRTFELPTTRDHRYHHRHPNNLFTLLLNAKELAELLLLAVPAVVVVGGLVVGLVAGEVPWGALVSGAICGYVLVGVYEWTHYLIHTAYRPRSPRLPAHLAQPPPAPLQERALLARDHQHARRPRAGHRPRPAPGPRSETARTLDPGRAG